MLISCGVIRSRFPISADASFENGIDVEALADRLYVLTAALELGGRSSRHHLQGGNTRQVIQNLFRQALGEILDSRRRR